ncbi:hypothetical protein [Kineococcus xinjiangensis]|uniref:hypothetical protein n=1 Tax=Kineococcus xinjiangensis TaxID=512762 RepID=UPI000CEB91B3|nr:hypothetical protein [Kineococcus xinjiangensis]
MLAPRLAAPGACGRGGTPSALVRLTALDLWGGAWCNNTPAAARWYHRLWQGARRRLLFCAAHLHPFAVAWLDGERAGRLRWTRACVQYGYLLLAATAIEGAPGPRSRRVLGVSATAGGWCPTGRWARRRARRGSRRAASPSCSPVMQRARHSSRSIP